MKIAILGYGTVGSGVYDIITNGKTEELDKIEVKSVFARSRDKMHLATDDINEIINDEEISVVVLAKIKDKFQAGFADDEQTKETIKAIYEKDNYLLDTHTAVAYKVLLENLDDEHASIVLSTASPYKFTESVYSSLLKTQGEDEFTLMNKLHEQTKVVIPENLRDLDKKEIRHKDVINKEDMKKYILEKLGDL